VFAALLLTIFFISIPSTRVVAGETVAEKEGYVKIETTRAVYLINQVIANSYNNQTLSGFINDVDERFGKIMNITTWSSEKFHGQKLEVTVDPPSTFEGGTGGYGSAQIFWGKDFPLTNESARQAIERLFLHEMVHGITPHSFFTSKWLAEGLAVYLSSGTLIPLIISQFRMVGDTE
jgi:hypothetical protein